MELILFILTYFLLAVNVIGYGYFFATNISSYNKNTNIGYIGLYGVFLLTFISYLTNLVVKHDYLHNFILLILGIFFFVKYGRNYFRNFSLIVLTIISLATLIIAISNY